MRSVLHFLAADRTYRQLHWEYDDGSVLVIRHSTGAPMDDKAGSGELLGMREEIAALTRRIERLERALGPEQSSPPMPTNCRAAERRAAISAYREREYQEFLRRNPGIVQRLAEDRAALNTYLRDRGFEAEPDGED